MSQGSKRFYPATLMGLALLAGVPWGCGGGSPAEGETSPSRDRPGPTAEPTKQLRLKVDTHDPSLVGVPLGPLRLRVRSILSGRVFDTALWDVVDQWPRELTLDIPFEDELEATVYVDFDANARFDPCPFPRGVVTEPDLTTIDTVRGVGLVQPGSEDVFEVGLYRVFCGPGTLDTGIAGLVTDVSGAEEYGVLFLYLERLDQNGRAIQIKLDTPITTTEEDGASVPSIAFSVGELLPGPYRVTVFTDDDKDGHPTPCSEALGGGDRMVSTPVELQVVPGLRQPLPEPLMLTPRACPTPMTGLRGQIALNDRAQLSVRENSAGPLPILEGGAHLTLIPPNSSDAVLSYQIFQSVDSRPFPQNFTVTGLPEGLWRVVFFVDRDANGRFAPCDGLPAGFDRLYAILEDVRINAESVIEVGTVALADGNCGNAPPTGLRGTVSAVRELGAVGSGRPIRMELYPTFDEGERLSFLLFENHWSEEDQTSVFTQEVPPGSYQARIYLDTDRDGDYSSCEDDPYGDRASSNLFSVVLEAGQLLGLGSFTLEVAPCAVPQPRIELSLTTPEGDEPDFARMRMALEESGGWAEDRELRGRQVLGVWVADPTLVAPGDYGLVVYEDRDANGQFNPCDDGGSDRISVSAEVSLDGDPPRLTTTLDLTVHCR